MYALLCFLLTPPLPHDWTDYGPGDPFWTLSVLNLVIGIAAARSRTVLGLCVWLVLLDVYLGTLACFLEAATEWRWIGADQGWYQGRRAIVGGLALAVSVWISSNREVNPCALPLRGIWARKFVVAFSLLFAQASSASGGAILAVLGLPGRIYYLDPIEPTWSQFACCLTLPFYVAPAWKYVSAQRTHGRVVPALNA